ncbi:prolipoprotein diacylglyceryl transferase [Prochlorococcus marinus]|uniref:prolipoprotein diacylglyceryl transferase n=1 Tax=Prochlorococcus marinus TaxID=1219 RepID=UPI0022B46F47|nr:prolipoprotein diacylglyceryl transferase [Prochlorococcus marinus]
MEAIIAALISPGPILEIGVLHLRWYGILIALAVLIGLRISSQLAKSRDLPNNLINDLLPILVLSSIIGARIYYVVFEWRKYNGIYFWSQINLFGITFSIPSFLEVWSGGIAIHGALIMGTISVIFFCKYKKQNFWDVLDVLLPSVALGQAIGRWGNFFNNEAFGIPTDLPWKLFIPYYARPDEFLNYKFFHPTFLYESLWNICIFFLLINLFRLNINGSIKLPSGALSCIYLISYGFGRIWIEGLRIDPLCIGSTPPFCEGGFKIAQIVSLMMICLGALGLLWIYQIKRKMPKLGIINKKR